MPKIAESALPNQCRKVRDDAIEILVLPEAHHLPAGVLECCSLFSVPGDIALKFEGPIVSVDVWLVTVLGAAVPEAPVDEDRDLLSSECDIRPEQLAIDPEGVVLPESVSESMKS